MNITEKLAGLKLPENGYIVVGSGILNALNIRESDDIDLVVTDELFQKYQAAGWEKYRNNDQELLRSDVYDIGTQWFGMSLNELRANATYIDTIPYLNLQTTYDLKKMVARKKDLADVALIDAYNKK